MKALQTKKILCAFLVVGLCLISWGCRPSVVEVAGLLYKVPLGASRDEVRKVLVEAYGKKYPSFRHDYGLVDPPRPVTEAILKADRELISVFKADHCYVRIYPHDLYEKMPSGALIDGIGIVAEASEGNGSVSVFYDSHEHYLGFLSFASGMDR